MPEVFFTAEKTSKKEFMARDWPQEISFGKSKFTKVTVLGF